MRYIARTLGLLALATLPGLVACDDDGPTGDNTAPTVLSTQPANLATNVSRTETIGAIFSEPILASSVTPSTFTISAGGNAIAGGTREVDGNTVTWTPAVPLAAGTTYTVTFTTGVQDVAGNGLVSNRSWTFTTQANAPPVVMAVTPPSAATNVLRETTITAAFDENILPASANAQTFTVTPGGGAPIAGTITVNNAIVTFTPNLPLAYGTIYTARLTTGITDLEGAPLAQEKTWSFATVNNADPTAFAGDPQDVNRGATVQLTSIAADPEGRPITYRWTQVVGPDVTGGLGFLTGANPTFTAPATVSTVRFELRVTDDGGAQSQASVVQINVMEDRTRAIFVSPLGNDNNTGTRASPVQTVIMGLAKANNAGGGTDVYIANGTYAGSHLLQTGVSLYGGFATGTWIRDPANHPTTLIGPTNMVGLYGSQVSDITLDGLRIETPPDFISTGQSAYAIFLTQSQNIRITNNRISSGEAGPGSGGQFGFPGVPGLRGGDGGNASCSTLTPGTGGAGGQTGQPSAGSQLGFVGGAGGPAALTGPGSQGQWGGGPNPGTPGSGGQIANGPQNGNPGGAGAPGTNGQNGQAAPAFGTLVTSGYLPAAGADGTHGTSGSGGSGGGAGASGGTGFGGGGGGGGASGGGGNLGQAGQGGGGSFGIFLLGSTGIVIQNNTIITSKGGNGGIGGRGGNGAIGGPAGVGGAGCNGAGNGGMGGAGGQGGDGGHGGGGGGGPSIGIFEDAASVSTITGNTYQIGTAGEGGFSEGNPGAAGITATTRKQP